MNKLKDSKSAFLRLSADSEINWYEWGEEAFRKAKEEDKPILVDVGAAWCHWCHVMDETTYKDKEVIRIINENFIAIKVDRDEMPDLDKKLQLAVSSLTGESGWPLTVFMTPEGQVFYGGTYFPPDDAYGRIGFKKLLLELSRVWKEERDKITQVAETLHSSLESITYSKEKAEWDKVEEVVSAIVSNYDFDHGGLQGTMKFPHPTIDELLLAYSYYTNSDTEARLSMYTLKKMYYGGIFDQVGGGFHRYTVDDEWYVPHFEKLLIDNAELLLDYVHAYHYSTDTEILDALTLTSDFILREMFLGEGFANSLDADSEGKEGYYYTWTEDEFRDALQNEDYRLWVRVFNVDRGEEVEGRKVLKRTADLKDLSKHFNDPLGKLKEVRAKLLEYRETHRKPPFKDDNTYTYPNARVAQALLESSIITGKGMREALKVIEKISPNVSRRLDGGKEGLPEDYASALLAIITAYEVTGDKKYRELSIELSERVKSLDYNYPVDSPNESVASLALKGILKTKIIKGETIDLEVPFAPSPLFTAGVTQIVSSLVKGTAHVVIVNEKDGKADSLHKASLLSYHPMKVVEVVTPDDVDFLPSFIRSMVKFNQGSSRAYVCKGNTCSMPVTSTENIKLLLKSNR
ncbi:thioredoxin domain-containing protein [Stygiolobus caldivivus]|uniref:Thioredoxin domain-containing protein n=1 Tax=Stygiolobus caldivivus TaxID=2824673 RepID=A0A8D5ZIJ3_9CREN|nr:thioredoxin domain-containing protein [Stygiolobus caldivivus]BCU69450.1 thioredoxin domain-containing protein [Stygiolobus caldivivus]